MDQKLSALGSLSPAQLADLIYLVRNGSPNTSGKATVADIVALADRGPNFLINGSFEVAQRAASAALTTSFSYLSVDRWLVAQAGTANGIAAQVGLGLGTVPGYRNALKIGRNAGAVTTGFISANYAMPTADAYKLQGQAVCLSWWAAGGANFSASGGAISIDLSTGNGTDQSGASYPIGGWTGQSQKIGSSQVVTTTWTRYARFVTLPNNFGQVGVQIGYTPTGTAGADDNLYLTGVDVRPATLMPVPGFRLYSQELALCLPYHERWQFDVTNAVFGMARVETTSSAKLVAGFKVRKFKAPAISNSAAANFILQVAGSNVAVTSLGMSNANTDTAQIDVGTAAVLTAGQAAQLTNTNAGSFIAFDAEL